MLEDGVQAKEIRLEISPSKENRASLIRVEVDFKRYLQRKVDFLGQKARIKWFTDGERNKKFFHTYMKGRRRTL